MSNRLRFVLAWSASTSGGLYLIIALALGIGGMCGCREKPKSADTPAKPVASERSTITATTTATAAVILPAMSIGEVQACDRKSDTWDAAEYRRQMEKREAKEAAERYKPVKRTLREFVVGEEIWDVNLYGVDGKVYICCRSSEFGRSESGRWEVEPNAKMRLRRAKDGWLLDCGTPTTVITNSIDDVSIMQPIVGTFNEAARRLK